VFALRGALRQAVPDSVREAVRGPVREALRCAVRQALWLREALRLREALCGAGSGSVPAALLALRALTDESAGGTGPGRPMATGTVPAPRFRSPGECGRIFAIL
jgi:hypothetical protein